MKAYRIRLVDDKVYGRLERNVNKNQEKRIDKNITIEINDRPYLQDNMLYCPDINMIVDETEKFLINKKINSLTLVETPTGHQLKSLRDMTSEERDEYWSLQEQYDNFYSKEVKFIEYGKEDEYIKNLKSLLNKDAK